MLKRTITGLCILIVLSGFIALKLVSAWFFDAIILVVIYGCLLEMFLAYKMADKKYFKLPLLALPVINLFCFKVSSRPLIFMMVAVLGIFIYSMITELIINAKNRRTENTANVELDNTKLLGITKTTMSVVIYPTTLLSFLFAINDLPTYLGIVGLIMVFGISIFTDVFAYCFGMLFGQKGGAKIAPEISPKKSVVGCVFGAVGGLIAGGLGYLFFVKLNWLGAFVGVSAVKLIIMFALMGVVGSLLNQFGDLVASAFKRMVGIKDYGNVFPGHGGFMDRVDGQMFNCVFVYLMLILFVL